MKRYRCLYCGELFEHDAMYRHALYTCPKRKK